MEGKQQKPPDPMVPVIDLVGQVPLFEGLSESLLIRVAQGSAVVQLKNQEVYRTSHDQCRHVSYVFSGCLKIIRTMPSDQEMIMRQVKAGETFGEVIALSEGTYPGWLISAGITEILEIPVEQILELCEGKGFLKRLLQDISRKVIFLSTKIDILSVGRLEDRLRRYLLNLYEQESSLSFMLPVTKTELAGELGCTRESLSRIFSQLQEHSIITQHGRSITVIEEEWFFKE